MINISNSTSKSYGISQDSYTKKYFIVFKNYFCEKCDKKYTDKNKWCQPRQINNFKVNFANWTSRDKIVDHLTQMKQLFRRIQKEIL